MHTVHQRWLVHKKVYSYAVQFVEPTSAPGDKAERTAVCLFRRHVDAYGFCAWLNGGSEPKLSRQGHEDLNSWNTPPKEELEE